MWIITTSDGSHTLYLPEMDEQYHSVNGAITESEYVYLDKGFNYFPGKNPKVFEVGFGTGLNCLLTALQAEKSKRQTNYISIEKLAEMLSGNGKGVSLKITNKASGENEITPDSLFSLFSV